MSLRPRVAFLLSLTLAAGCHPEGGIKVTDLAFEGVKAVKASELKAALATSESSWLPWGPKRYFNRAQFEADLKRITAFYADRGFPDAKVVSFDVQMNDKQDEVKLRIRVDEGLPIVVDDVRFTGFDPLPEDHLARLRKELSLKPGAPRDMALVQITRERALDELRDHGYPYARVHVTETPVADRRVVITYAAEPGPAAVYGPIEIAGNTSVDDGVIRRQLTFRPGQRFRLGQLQESQRKLYGLELFEFANVEALETDRPSVEVPIRVTVTEGRHRRVTFGIGYGTEEKIRGTVDWRHVNFFGGARTAGIEGKWSSLDRGVRLSFNEPYFFHPRYSFSASAQGWFSNEVAYDLDTRGARLTVTRLFGAGGPRSARPSTTTMSLSYVQNRESYTIAPETLLDLTLRDDLIALGLDPRTLRGGGLLAAFDFDAQRNTTGNILDAKRGYVAALHVEHAGSLLPGDFDYREVTLEGRHYLTIADRLVLANRAKIGAINGPDPIGQHVPFFKRYFLGGSTSLRGWGRFEVAPLSGSGLPLGGHSMLELSSEVRVPIWGNLGGVLFVDAGNAWAEPWRFHLGDLRIDAGPGLRYLTPIGPIRFDVGFQLNPIEGLLVDGKEQRWPFRLHFSIGQAF